MRSASWRLCAGSASTHANVPALTAIIKSKPNRNPPTVAAKTNALTPSAATIWRMNCWLVVALPTRATGCCFVGPSWEKASFRHSLLYKRPAERERGGTIMRKLQFVKLVLIGFVGAAAMELEASDLFAAGKPAEKAASGGDAKLVITRRASLGSGSAISVLVDGEKVGTVQSGNRYNGTVSAGKHTLSVRFEPVSGGDKPATVELNVVAGQTYSFSATIKSGAIALQ